MQNTVTGRAACVDPANFNLEIGRNIAREDIDNQLWKLEGYLLQEKLYQRNHAKDITNVNLAMITYERYSSIRDYENHKRSWDDLPTTVKNAWYTTIEAVLNELAD